MASWYQPVAETEDFLVINKAPGANLHRNQSSQSLLDILKQDYRQASLFLVHRLDDATSGLLLIAKNRASAALLAELFARREVEKYYLAIAAGKPSKKQGAVIGDMVKARNGSYRLCRSRDNPASSCFFSVSVGVGRRLYLLRPLTGKTHQLRVALKSLGAPILGDRRYGGLDADRCYLHAYQLRFCYRDELFAYHCLPDSGDCFGADLVASALLDWATPWTLDWPGAPTLEG